jgi:hypothetical protein
MVNLLLKNWIMKGFSWPPGLGGGMSHAKNYKAIFMPEI